MDDHRPHCNRDRPPRSRPNITYTLRPRGDDRTIPWGYRPSHRPARTDLGGSDRTVLCGSSHRHTHSAYGKVRGTSRPAIGMVLLRSGAPLIPRQSTGELHNDLQLALGRHRPSSRCRSRRHPSSDQLEAPSTRSLAYGDRLFGESRDTCILDAQRGSRYRARRGVK